MKRSKRYIKKQTKSFINKRGVKLEDVTPELEQKAFEEMR